MGPPIRYHTIHHIAIGTPIHSFITGVVSKNQLPQSQQTKNEVILTWGLNGGGSVISSQAGLYTSRGSLYQQDMQAGKEGRQRDLAAPQSGDRDTSLVRLQVYHT